MSITLQAVSHSDAELLLPLLRDADEDEQRIVAILTDGTHTSYTVMEGEMLIGAVTLRWEPQESEIEYIAIASQLRGRGYGRAVMRKLLEEAQRRGTASLLVGTDNTAFTTIAFYQKCGFRMDSVRRDYFSYVQPPVVHDGIPMRDMLVLRHVIP